VTIATFDKAEYGKLKAFLAFFSERYLDLQGLPDQHHPTAALEELERKRPEKAADGLRMAINDCLEISNRWRPDRVRKVDEELRKTGLLTLSELRRRYSRAYARILKRGRIASEVDYYLIKGIRDTGSPDLSAPEITQLNQLLSAYEETAMKNGKPG